MAWAIKPKRSNTASVVPTTSDLADGEFAINSADKIVYMRDGASIVEVANYSSGGGTPDAPVVINANTTLDGSHLNKHIEKTSSTSYTFTIPGSYGSAGDMILFVNNSAGNMVVARGSGVTLYRYGGNANVTIPARRSMLIVRTTTSNVWNALC